MSAIFESIFKRSVTGKIFNDTIFFPAFKYESTEKRNKIILKTFIK